MSTCGTGLDVFGPKPGDPVMSIATIQAWAILGGVFVQWSYPSQNAHAIAHSLLFRSTTNDVDNITQIALVNGSQYNDMLNVEAGVGLYYWVRFVSVNGTVGPLIGPAYVVPRSTIGDIIIDLENQITGTQLSLDLQSRIDRITDLTSGLSDETQQRLLGDTYLNELWDQLNRDVQDVDTLIANEVIQRVEADSALAATLNLVFAKANENAAAIAVETAARADAVSSVALMVTTLEASIADEYVAIQQFAAVQANVNGLMTAEYYVKLDNRGRVSGFGIADNGSFSEFAVNADFFSIGDPGSFGKTRPFIVTGGNTYIKNALIQNAAIDTLKVAGNAIFAASYDAGVDVAIEGDTVALTPGAAVVFLMTHTLNVAPSYDIWFRFYQRQYGSFVWTEIPGTAMYGSGVPSYVSNARSQLVVVPGVQGGTTASYHLRAKIFFYANGTAAGGTGTPIVGGATITAIGAKR